MNTLEAFTELMYTPAIWKRLGIPAGRVLYYRHALKYGQQLNYNKLKMYLELSGKKKSKEDNWA
jgi:hypothetical protein